MVLNPELVEEGVVLLDMELDGILLGPVVVLLQILDELLHEGIELLVELDAGDVEVV